jgi:hypothetical protein
MKKVPPGWADQTVDKSKKRRKIDGEKCEQEAASPLFAFNDPPAGDEFLRLAGIRDQLADLVCKLYRPDRMGGSIHFFSMRERRRTRSCERQNVFEYWEKIDILIGISGTPVYIREGNH